ncbi:hypothetical protein [Saccharopolyspora sp. NPDC002686]|uniref:hypothetical protein n=1 Tax=Saccharopolyspora sp. NPDC002686 TaxID=3154541 RepID=UPI003331B288
MLRLRRFFERFRPAGTPGAAACRGVPADRVAELAAELAPVFELLADTEAEAERIRAAGRQEAELVRQRAREQADAIVADSGMRAAEARAAVVSEAYRQSAAESVRTAASADRAADELKALARERMPAMADRAVAVALTALGESPETTP